MKMTKQRTMKTNFHNLFRKLDRTIFIGLLTLALQVNVSQAQLSFTVSGQNLGNIGYACAIGDLNNDGYPDIYIVNCDKPDEIWFNNGKAIFINSNQKIGNTIKYNKNAGLADLDGDGDLDIFIANDADWGNKNPTVGLPNEVWLNEGNGKFTDSGQRLGNLASIDVALGDVDGDGDIDAVIANLHNTDLSNLIRQPNEVWLNDGKGNFSNSGQSLGVGSLHVKLVDIDGDGDLDAVFQHPIDGSFVIWLNRKGKFTKSNNTLGNGSNITFGDIDSDGDQDAFIVKGGPNRSAPCEIWLNEGSSKFTDSGQRLGNLVGYDVALGDLDGDGDFDALVTNGTRTAQTPILWINQGGKEDGKAGTFKESGVVFPNSQIAKVKLFDLDKDGDLDIVITNYAGANKIYFNNTSNSNYLNLTPPGNTIPNVLPDSIPLIFAPGIVSTNDCNEHTLTISPDGREIYFTRDPLNIWSLKVIDGKWSLPEKTELKGREPILSPDGNKLFFNDGDIWYTEKINNTWNSPKKLDSTINKDKHEYYASVTRAGTLYFSRIIERGNPKIFYSRQINGSFSEAIAIDSVINNGGAYHPFISPDEDYIIFNSNKPGGFGEADLYISYKDEKGHWTKPVNLGSKINSALRDICPILSPDGKYLFFTRNWQENGKQYGDVYWVSAKIIDNIKKEVFSSTETK
jgi:hypothetical protein